MTAEFINFFNIFKFKLIFFNLKVFIYIWNNILLKPQITMANFVRLSLNDHVTAYNTYAIPGSNHAILLTTTAKTEVFTYSSLYYSLLDMYELVQ